MTILRDCRPIDCQASQVVGEPASGTTPMTSLALESFITQATARSHVRPEPAECVLALAPLMLDLIEHAGTFLQPHHYQSSDAGYTRNLIYDAPDKHLSLYALVWLPGQ